MISVNSAEARPNVVGVPSSVLQVSRLLCQLCSVKHRERHFARSGSVNRNARSDTTSDPGQRLQLTDMIQLSQEGDMPHIISIPAL